MLTTDCWNHAKDARGALWSNEGLRSEAREIAHDLDEIATALLRVIE